MEATSPCSSWSSFYSSCLRFSRSQRLRSSVQVAKALSLEDDHHRGARQLVRLVERPETFLNGVLLMVLICQLVTATLVGLLAEHWFGNVGVFVALVFEIIVIFVLAEALPKNYAVRNPDKSALFSAPFVTVVVRFWPIWHACFCRARLARDQDRRRGPGHCDGERVRVARARSDVATEEDVIEHSERVSSTR